MSKAARQLASALQGEGLVTIAPNEALAAQVALEHCEHAKEDLLNQTRAAGSTGGGEGTALREKPDIA
jgi:hypothetical protein